MASINSPKRAASKKIKPSSAADGRKKARTSSLLKSLPESVEHIEIVQQVACVLEELQKRVLDVRAEASKELHKLMKRYESNYKGLEKKVHQVTSDAKRQAQTSMIQLLQKWHEHKEKLPAPLAKEIEKIVEQIGAKVVARKSAPKKVAVKKPVRATKTVAKTPGAKPKTKPAAKKTTKARKSTAAKATSASSPKRKAKAAIIAPKVEPMPPLTTEGE